MAPVQPPTPSLTSTSCILLAVPTRGSFWTSRTLLWTTQVSSSTCYFPLRMMEPTTACHSWQPSWIIAFSSSIVFPMAWRVGAVAAWLKKAFLFNRTTDTQRPFTLDPGLASRAMLSRKVSEWTYTSLRSSSELGLLRQMSF